VIFFFKGYILAVTFVKHYFHQTHSPSCPSCSMHRKVPAYMNIIASFAHVEPQLHSSTEEPVSHAPRELKEVMLIIEIDVQFQGSANNYRAMRTISAMQATTQVKHNGAALLRTRTLRRRCRRSPSTRPPRRETPRAVEPADSRHHARRPDPDRASAPRLGAAHLHLHAVAEDG
jgi:hypothetical protein